MAIVMNDEFRPQLLRLDTRPGMTERPCTSVYSGYPAQVRVDRPELFTSWGSGGKERSGPLCLKLPAAQQY